MAPALAKLQASLRERVPFLKEDALMAPLMEGACEWLQGQSTLDVSDGPQPQA